MNVSKFFIALFLVGGLFFMLSSNSMAENRFTIDNESIKSIVEQSRSGRSAFSSEGYTEIAWKVKLSNSSDKPLAFDITVAFVNVEDDTLGKTTRTSKLQPGESKMVSNLVLLKADQAKQIDSGYVSIAKKAGKTVDTEAHSIIATVGENIKVGIADHSDKYVKMDYNVKLRNKSSKPVTSDLTVAFLDEDNVKIGETKTKSSFKAGESKTITDTIVLRTSDISRIKSGHVSIEK